MDFVICNLYPFKEVTKKINVTVDEAIEEVDIGGVTLLRAAAKNHSRVTIISDPEDYPSFLDQLKKGEITESSRQLYALKAFSYTADYDVRAIASRISFVPQSQIVSSKAWLMTLIDRYI